jgi:hypothetical protein
VQRAFPSNNRNNCSLFRFFFFDHLSRAYVDARYNKTYKITDEELNIVSERGQKLKEIAAKRGGERIEELQNIVNGNSEHSG